MTKRDVLEQLQIPAGLLEEYECLPLQDFTADQGYNRRDMERLSLMLTLHEIGFSREEALYVPLPVGAKHRFTASRDAGPASRRLLKRAPLQGDTIRSAGFSAL